MESLHKQPAGLKDITNITHNLELDFPPVNSSIKTNMKTTSSNLDEQDKENANPSSAVGGSKEPTKKILNRGRWTKEEDQKLKKLIENHGARWTLIASQYHDRSDVQCHHRWSKTINPEIVKGAKHKEATLGHSETLLFTMI